MRQMLQLGMYSAFEMVYRTALIYANLREAPSGFFTRSDAYDALDPSEKGAVSYFLGLAASKLFAERCLQVPWLLHLDVYRKQLQAVLKSGRSKPDLIGQDSNGNWVVIESKGRTNEFDAAALRKAKAQSRRVRSISGIAPTLRIGMQSYFESSQLCLWIDDPDEPDEDAVLDLPIPSKTVIEEYYQPFRDWLDRAAHADRIVVQGQVYVLREEPTLDLAIGLAEKRYRRVAAETQASVRPSEDQFVGSDGVLARLCLRPTRCISGRV